MTIEIDSEVPSSHPFSTIIETTLTMTTETHIIARKESIIFPVATKRTTNEKAIAQSIPLIAELMKALSDSIQLQ